jgi:hypothetical protein
MYIVHFQEHRTLVERYLLITFTHITELGAANHSSYRGTANNDLNTGFDFLISAIDERRRENRRHTSPALDFPPSERSI